MAQLRAGLGGGVTHHENQTPGSGDVRPYPVLPAPSD